MQDRLPFSGFVANFDGKQIQNKEELFRFLEKNVGLPDANNWSSITDWLTDLSWIKAEEYNFILENYDSFLKDDLSSKDLFLEILEEDILPWWVTTYVGYNQYYNKPYTTFSDGYSKVKGKIPVFNRNPVIPEVNLKVDINGKTITETTKPYDREHILRNIEESRLARENSGFKDFSTTRLQPVVKPQPAPKNLDVEGPVVNNIQSKYPDLQTYEYNSYTNPGPLNDLRGQPNVNFYGGRYDVEVLKSPKILYRAGDQSNPLGQWFTESAPHSEIEVRINTAVKPIWTDRSGNYTGSSPLNTVYEIKIPAGTTIYRGPVASQGGIYQGGLKYEQIFIETPWKIEGVEVISSKPLN